MRARIYLIFITTKQHDWGRGYIELLYLLSKSSPGVQTLQLAWSAALFVPTDFVSLPHDKEDMLCKGVRRILKNKEWGTHEGDIGIVDVTKEMDDRPQIIC